MNEIDLFDLFAKISLNTEDYENGLEEASGKTHTFADKIRGGLATAAKVGGAALAAAAAGVAALTKQSIANYAEYEQLVGGVETLFKSSGNAVIGYANNAYKTAGLSANQYMSTATSFSASLLQSLGQDTEAAARYADMAITDMSDNANKMGTSMEMIQNAYQGFAKQNYTMLDNLKLGYGGTKEEMKRLLSDAEKLSGLEFDISSYADVVDAIHIVQTEMGIAGTTALEASTTITGSLNATKAAWGDLLVEVAKADGDIEAAMGKLVNSSTTLLSNLMPIFTNIIKQLPEMLKGLVDAFMGVFPELATALLDGAIELLPSIVNLIMMIGTWIVENIPTIIESGLYLIIALAQGITEAIPKLIPAIVECIMAIVDWVLDNIDLIIKLGIQITLAIAVGLIEALPELISKVPEIVVGVASAIYDALPALWEAGKAMINALWDGIKETWESLKSWFSDAWSSLFGGTKSASGKNIIHVNGSHASGLNYVPFDGYIAELHRGEMVVPAKQADDLRQGKTRPTVSVVQYISSEAKTAADLMQEAVWYQERAVLTGV